MAKADLSREAIVDRALAVADAEGLDAVTVRRLGQEFGVTPMALYWHVKNKDELLDAMGDALFASVEYDDDPALPWDVRLHSLIRGLVNAFREHPACLDLAYRRVIASAEGLDLTEYALGLVRTAGFTRQQTANIVTRSLTTALMLVGSEPGAEPGHAPEEAEALLAAKRERLGSLPAERFPFIHEMAADMLDCADVDAYYEFNIELFVAGARATLSAGEVAARKAIKKAAGRRPSAARTAQSGA